jgi:hypothetical protein
MIMIEIPERMGRGGSRRVLQTSTSNNLGPSVAIRRGCIGANDRVRQSHGFAATATLAMDHDSI